MENVSIVIVDKNFNVQNLQGLVIRSEENANKIKIQFPKTYEGEDLTGKIFILKCTNANGVYFETLLPKTVTAEYIELLWTVTAEFTTVSGVLKIAIFAESANYSLGTTMSKVIVEESPQYSIPIDDFTVLESYMTEIRVAADIAETARQESVAIKQDLDQKIVDNLASTDPKKILSANQGRVLDERINNIVGYSGTSTVEVVDARNSPERGTVYPTLKARLDAVDNDIVKSTYSTPAEATAPIISLPSTAVKGKLEGSIKGNTLYQAIVNGDFSNETGGWLPASAAKTIFNNILKFTATASGGGIAGTGAGGGNITLSQGQKYFFTARIKSPSSLVRIQVDRPDSPFTSYSQKFHSGSGQFEDVNFLYTASETVTTARFRFRDGRTANWTEIEVTRALAIPITGTIFENWTADQINAMIDGYWEGLQGTGESSVKCNETELFAPVKLNRLPNNIADEFTMDGTYIQRTAEKTSQTGAVNYADMATGGSFIAQLADGTIQTGIKGATLTATATKIIYQLATPIETQYPSSNLIAEASGSIYVDSKIKISKAYGINITVTNKIKALESVYRIKGDSRVRIDNSLVTIAGDGLSLTILNASAGEIYEVVYEPYGALLPTLSYSYPNDLAAQSAGNTKAISQIDKNFADFMSYQNAVNVQVDFRLIAGGH